MKITDAQLKQIYAHAKETYPYECCGFLLGSFEAGGWVRQVRRATNQNQERTDRFVISGEEFGQVQFAADWSHCGRSALDSWALKPQRWCSGPHPSAATSGAV